MNCGSPNGIAIAPTTLIAASTAMTGLKGMALFCRNFN
jgi:hypothetical protein